MLIRIDPGSSAPIPEQIASQVRRGIADGSVIIGERLPAARELAAALEINMHTVLRAYELLRDSELIELRRGRGAIVIAGNAHGMTQLFDSAAALIAEAGSLGISPSELANLIRGMA
jgi:GntR family transcriptional regulator